MSINVIHTTERKRESVPAGNVRQIITSNDGAKDIRAAIYEIEPNKSQEFNSEKRSHLFYVIEGSGGEFTLKNENMPRKKARVCIWNPATKPPSPPAGLGS